MGSFCLVVAAFCLLANSCKTVGGMLCVQDDIDLVTTDVLACMMIIGQEDSQRRSNVVRPGSQSHDKTVSPQTWMNIPRARHYMHYAQAAYGWPWYILPSKNLFQSLWRLYHISRFASCFKRKNSIAEPVMSITLDVCFIVCVVH